MRKYGRDNRPHLKPVTRIELSEKNIKLRTVLIVVFLSIGAVALMTGLFQLINVEPGWQEIEVTSDQPHCGGEISFMYDFQDYGGGATAANRQLSQLYSQAAEDAFALFTPDVEVPQLHNLYYLNRHLNETVTVEPVLYEAFALLEKYGSRSVYLAPVYTEYKRIFFSESDPEAAMADPGYNEELLPYITQAAAFAHDPNMIRAELLGDNRLRLTVSQEYMAFLETYEIDTVVDFSWLKNAFIVDHIADILLENGYTCGYLTSYDGFTRNLDSRDHSYSVNIFDRQANTVYMPARLDYRGPMSIVFLRDYAMTELDRWHYYTYESGTATTVFLDSADGRSKASIDSLTAYSANFGCAEMLLQLIPVYVADRFDAQQPEALAKQGIYTLWCEGSTLLYNDPDARLELLADKDGNFYQKQLTQE